MAATGYRVIHIKSATNFGAAREEDNAAAAITPGELLEFNAAGNLQAHSGAGGLANPKMVALETMHADAEGTEQIDVDYASADVVYYAMGRATDVFYMWLAGSQNVSRGDELESDGAGALQAAGTAPAAGAIVAVAAEDVDNSTNGSRVRIKAQIV